MKIPYITFMKHAEKVTKSVPPGRPILKGVHHTGCGDLITTDAHRLYLAKSVAPSGEPIVLDPKTGDLIDGEYPSVDRLIPNANDANAEIVFNTEELLLGMNALLKCNLVAKNEKAYVKLNVTQGSVPTISVKNSYIFSQFTGGYYQGDEDVNLVFDTRFFVDALNLFKACKIDEIILRYYGSLRPFTITPETSLDLLALISPLRTEGPSE
ncbi:hypothetical protein P4284_22890 [Bacillus swezeyi]|uniref:hypothetical protein n=1 Tax=Bacillus swezeyi TaxID=1925020 RepID=UPI002E217D88|nr:hypothetical protein [Bacillus swezeyi]